MAEFCEAILAVVGLIALLVIVGLWIAEREATRPDDALRRIMHAADEAHIAIEEEESRQRATQWQRHNAVGPSSRPSPR